jgi:adenylate cyclase class 2
MPRNLEIKASIPSLRTALSICRRIGARRTELLRQTDTYFDVEKGRLKLREINGKKFELIYYERANHRGSRYSDYTIVSVDEPAAMKSICISLFGVKLIVRKNRILFLYRNARIHLDRVRDLGTFIEFEVLVKQGQRQARQLMEYLILEFGVSKKSSIAGSYEDLLYKK